MARRRARSTGQRGKFVPDGVLAGHYRQGKVFRTTLNAYEATHRNDWSRDDLPDLLWPLLLAHLQGDQGAISLSKAQHLLLTLIDEEYARSWPVALDGRLTSLERFPDHVRDVFLSELRTASLDDELFPPELVGVMRLYPDCPGVWIFGDGWSSGELPKEAESATLLASAIVGALADRHTNALVKAGVLSWQLQVGSMHWPREMLEDLSDWPANADSRSQGDATILSGFLAAKGLDEENNDALDWAQQFWIQNWHSTPCLLDGPDDEVEPDDAIAGDERQEQDDVEESAPASAETSESEAEERPETVGELVDDVLEKLWDEYVGFLKCALDPDLAVDLRQPARHEVTCGLVAWVCRSLLMILRYPMLWSGEHAVLAMRQVVEATIVLEWMQEQGDEAFDSYQSYGLGKRKLMLAHATALSEDFDGEAPEILTRLIGSLDDKVGGMTGEFTDVSIEGSFSGKSMRRMAEEVGRLGEWRHLYQPASGVIHGEWWAIEDYAMERCMNPLHRFHALPSRDLITTPTLQFGETALAQFRRLAVTAREVLGTQDRTDGTEDKAP
jgi:hypothetical protein